MFTLRVNGRPRTFDCDLTDAGVDGAMYGAICRSRTDQRIRAAVKQASLA
jgi:hypothetical protein